jgi:CRISPR-associated protein Cas1
VEKISRLHLHDAQHHKNSSGSIFASSTPAGCPEQESGDDLDWADRSAHWEQQSVWRPRRAHQKRKHRNPLILGGHGVRLRIDRGSLLVQNGFTHYPQKREEWRFFPGHPDMPSRIVVVDADGSVTFDVLAWLSTQAIPLIQVNWQGDAIVVAGANGYVADPKIAQAQKATHANEARRLAICCRLVTEKFAATLGTLEQAIPASPGREIALQEAASSLRQMRKTPPEDTSALRGIEGRVAQAYFRSWRPIELKWFGRKPVPDEWRHIGPRVSPKSGTNRDATHPVNAMLNYGYAVLESQVRLDVTASGLDPYLGYFHTQWRERQALVLDLMEPMRPVVDRAVLGFVQQHMFSDGDVTLRHDGVCRLNPQLARNVVGLLAMAMTMTASNLQAVIQIAA